MMYELINIRLDIQLLYDNWTYANIYNSDTV